MVNPFKTVAATYSFGMLLYWLINIFIYERETPAWLSEIYFIVYTLPALVGLGCTAKDYKEKTYRYFLFFSLLIFASFDFWCMIVGRGMLFFNRWVSAVLVISLPITFFALFLKLNTYKESEL